MGIFKNRFSKNGFWLLLSTCAFPIHVWTLILFFRDFSWVSERTNSWDAIGVGSYGLLIAFIESLFVFFIAVGLSFFLPNKWSEDKRTSIIGMVVLLVAFWAIIGQLYFLMEVQIPVRFLQVVARNSHPLWILYGIVLVFIGTTLALPGYILYRSVKAQKNIIDLFDRLSTLAFLYFFLDICGLVVVAIRNS